MKIHFVGDIHGYYEHLARIAAKTDAAAVVQVGDLGIMPGAGYKLPGNLSFAKPTYFIEGNHDDLDAILAMDFGTIPGLDYLRRGSCFTWGGRVFSFLGGADSIDKYARTEGVDWFRNEIPTEDDVLRLVEAQPEVVVTHTCPGVVAYEAWGMYVQCPLARAFDNAITMFPEFRPKLWIFGHHHKPFHGEVNGIEFHGLSYMGEQHQQLILDTKDLSVKRIKW
jgi:hypothetical protein